MLIEKELYVKKKYWNSNVKLQILSVIKHYILFSNIPRDIYIKWYCFYPFYQFVFFPNWPNKQRNTLGYT